jgi:hypothetical protein
MTPGQDFIEPDTVLKCGALQIKLPAFRRTSKVIFSTLHSSVDCRPPVGPYARIKLLFIGL